MTLTFSCNSVPLPLPKAEDPFPLEYMPFGISQRTANATLRVQFVTAKFKRRIDWAGLTKAERDLCFAAYVGGLVAAQTWIFPDGVTFSGMTQLSSWVENQWYQPRTDAIYHNVSFTVEEV